MKIRCYFEPRDLWVGLYWDQCLTVDGPKTYLYICLLPTLVIRFVW